MSSKRGKKKFGIDDIISIMGVVFFLLSVLLFLSPRTRLRGLAYGVTYLLGIAGFYAVSALVCLLGIHMLFHRKWKPFNVRVYIALPLLFYGFLALSSSVVLPDEFTSFQALDQAFHQRLDAVQSASGIGYYSEWSLGGGLLGNVFAFHALAVGKWLPILISALIFGLGLVLLFLPLICKLFKIIRAHHVLRGSRRAQKREEGTFSFGEETAPSPSPEPVPSPAIEPVEPSRADQSPFSDRPTPLASFSFEPAGSVLPKTRRQMRQNAEAHPEAQPKPAPIPMPYSPSPRPLQHSGLQEAFFDLDAEEQPVQGYHEIPSTYRPPVQPEVEEKAPEIEPMPARSPVVEEATEETFTRPTGPISLPTREFAEPEVEEPLEETIVPAFLPTEEEEIAPIAVEPIGEEVEEIVPNAPTTSMPEPAPAPSPTQAPLPNPEDEIPDAKPLPPYQYPPRSLLTVRQSEQDLTAMEIECQEKTEIINRTFADLGVGATVVGHTIGPSVTRFAIQPRSDVSVATLSRYIKDIEVRLGGIPTRFAERVAGMTTCALEVANRVARTVSFIELFDALPPKKEGVANLHVPFGLDISGEVKEADFSEFPHMLVAGTTGSGKSIFAHGLLLSLLMRNRPEELKLVLVDPKRVEMGKYKDIPHLLCPIIKEPNEARNALKRLCDEMERRLKIFDIAGVRDIKEFNDDYCVYAHKQKMPYIVLFIDEFSDLVNTCKDVSEYVLRIGQKARAAGIHMIVATQRPDVKVITGTIKANIPVKVALTVSSAVDSSTILGQGGAEDLNGKGDMLIDCVQIAKKEFVRAQGCFCDPHELRAVTDFIRNQMPVEYDPNFLHLEDDDEPENTRGLEGISTMSDSGPSAADLRNASNEEKYRYIRSVIITRDTASISSIQREFGLGFPRAGKIFARLQAEGIVAQSSDAPGSSKGCKVLIHELPPEEE